MEFSIFFLLLVEQIIFFEEVVDFKESELFFWQAENAGKIENEHGLVDHAHIGLSRLEDYAHRTMGTLSYSHKLLHVRLICLKALLQGLYRLLGLTVHSRKH